MKKVLVSLLIFLTVGGIAPAIYAQEETSVKGVLFHSPTCPHCHFVIDEVLPPLKAEYGEQLDIRLIDVTQSDGQRVYQRALSTLNLPTSRRGVPMLIVGDTVLVGSGEIPEQLPTLIANGLENGGVAWPAIPTLDAYLDEFADGASTLPGSLVGLGVVTLLLLFGVLAYATFRIIVGRPDWGTLSPITSPVIPALAVVGVLISAYLTYTKLTVSDVACAGSGSCNAVQGSSYATLLGLPVAAFGLIGYGLMFVMWYVQSRNALEQVPLRLGLTLLIGASLLFSIYLTLIEIFVIEAVCLWCVVSALITAVLTIFIINSIATPKPTRHKRRSGHRMSRT